MRLLKSIISISVLFLIIQLWGGCSKDNNTSVKPDETPTIVSISSTSASIDDTLIISGTNFGNSSPANSVKFNGTTATVTKAAVNSLSVVVPQGITSGKVALTVTVYGLQASYNFDFTKLPSVITYAGFGKVGYVNGPAKTAEFSMISQLTFDSSGNLYACELNSRIRKITSAGIVSTFAGDGTGSSIDGNLSTATFNQPLCVTIDASGNFYVTQFIDGLLRKISTSGNVTTIAGGGSGYPSSDGIGRSANLGVPQDVVVDPSGNLYITDRGGKPSIRKVTPAGVVTTFAGSGLAGSVDGTGTSASFRSPMGMCQDQAGNLYVADSENNNIRKISPAGVVTTIAGNGMAGYANGVGTSAQFNSPEDIAIDPSGNLYVTDRGNHRIRKINTSGLVTTVAGTGNPFSIDGGVSKATFDALYGITIDAKGDLYVADYYVIRKIVF